MNRVSAELGFTLIELIIALVVAALLFAWGVPSFQRFMDRTTLTSEINSFVGIINSARSEAITRGQRVTMCRTTDPDCSGTGTCSCGGSATFHEGVLVFASDSSGSVSTQFNSTAGHTLIGTHGPVSEKVVILPNDAADASGDGTLTFERDGTLNDQNQAATSARFVVCPLQVSGDASSVFNSQAVAARFVEISATGRPRVDLLTPGEACTSTAADDE